MVRDIGYESLFIMFVVQNVHCSECLFFRMFIVKNVHCSENEKSIVTSPEGMNLPPARILISGKKIHFMNNDTLFCC